MWTLDSPLLPASPLPQTTPPLAVLDDGTSIPTLAVLDIQADYQQVGVIQNWEPVVLEIEVPATVDNTTTFDLIANDVVQVDAIAIGNTLIAPAEDPLNPRPNEFTWNSVTQQAVVTLPAGLQVPRGAIARIIGGVSSDPTGVLPEYLLEPLRGLPVVGQISWTLSLEQEVSGSLNLVCQGTATIRALRQRFRKGTEFTLFGCGFSVGSFDAELGEDRYYQVAVNLTGRWSRPKYQQPSFYREEGRRPISAGDRELDPECNLPLPDPANPRLALPPQTISLAALAAQVGVPFVATASYTLALTPPLPPLGPLPPGQWREKRVGPLSYADPWHIRIPRDATRDATTTWVSEAQNLARVNGTYLDFSSPEAVYARSVQEGRTWNYSTEKFKETYQGDCEHVDDHRGYAVEYPNVRLEGLFSEPSDNFISRLQRPRWTRRSPVRVELETFDARYWLPPANVTRLKTMSLNWDSSGPTRSYRRVIIEDGMSVWEEERIYGFAYGSWQIYSESLGELSGDPATYWGIVSYKVRELLFDPDYGYEIGSNVTGTRKGRFKTETDSLEALEISQALGSASGESASLLQLEFSAYQFRDLPIIERNRKDLERLSSIYRDANEDPAYVPFKICSPDGTSGIGYVFDPSWAPALGVMQELTYVGGFAQMPNPENTADAEIRLPPLTTGEESISYVGRQVLASKNTRNNVVSSGTTLDIDVFVERSIEDSAQNANFNEKAVREAYSEKTGQIPAANRKPSPYEPVQPEGANDGQQNSEEIEYAHYLRTPGYETTDPVQGSVSYSAAQTVEQGVLAAKTDLLLRDVQESAQYSFALPFNIALRPMDRMNVNAQGEAYRVRVSSVSHTINIEGEADGRLILTSESDATQVTAGIDREIPVEVDRRPLPLPPRSPSDAPEIRGGARRAIGIEDLFEIIPRGRGNF